MKKFGRDHSRVFSFYLGQGAANQIEEKKPSSSSCHLTHFGAPINDPSSNGECTKLLNPNQPKW